MDPDMLPSDISAHDLWFSDIQSQSISFPDFSSGHLIFFNSNPDFSPSNFSDLHVWALEDPDLWSSHISAEDDFFLFL
jgi:hypothetical protein